MGLERGVIMASGISKIFETSSVISSYRTSAAVSMMQYASNSPMRSIAFTKSTKLATPLKQSFN